MAIHVILASFFTAGVYSVRVANKNAEHQSQADAHASDFIPGQLVPGLRFSAVPAAPAVLPSILFGNSPHINPHGRLAFSHSRPLWMSMQDPEYDPGIPDPDLPDLYEVEVETKDGKWSAVVIDEEEKTINETRIEEVEKNKLANASSSQYKLNLDDAIASLNRDIPQALRFERDPKRLAPTNWNIYTDSFESDFKAADPMALRLLAAVIPSYNLNIKGLGTNQRVLQELRTVLRTLELSCLEKEADVTVSTNMGVDPSTREDVIESRWIAEVVMKRLQLPQWLPPPPFGKKRPRKSDTRIVQIEALSRFYLDAEGKIYRQTIDELDLFVDKQRLDSKKLQKFLDFLARLPVPRIPLFLK